MSPPWIYFCVDSKEDEKFIEYTYKKIIYFLYNDSDKILDLRFIYSEYTADRAKKNLADKL